MKQSFEVVAGLAVAGMLAAGTTAFWTRDFQDWTEKDAKLMLRDSPWAKQVAMPAGARAVETVIEPGSNGAPPPSDSLGNPANTTTGTNMTVSANPGSAGPADANGRHTLSNTRTASTMGGETGAPEPEPALTVIWASATPVRLAVLKIRSGSRTPAEAEIVQARQPRPNYVLAVVGLPPPEAGTDPNAPGGEAWLKVNGRPPERANQSRYRKIGDSDVYFFNFPKATFPLSAADGQVEFQMRMGSIHLKKKFDLAAMQFNGKLAL